MEGNSEQVPGKRDILGVLQATGGQQVLWAYCQSQSAILTQVLPNVPGNASDIVPTLTHNDSILRPSSQQSVRENKAVDLGLLQARFELSGEVDQNLFAAAWQTTSDQFEALRTTVHPNEKYEILLVCRRSVSASVQFESWQPDDEAQQQQLLDSFLKTDSAKGIDLSIAPSSRVTCISLSASKSMVVWTCHHLLLDGWSAIVIINAFLANYASHSLGQIPPPAEHCRYSQYRQWLKVTDTSQSLDFWKNHLRGLHTRTTVCPSYRGIQSQSHDRLSACLTNVSATESLDRSCKSLGLTIASVIQSAWLLVVCCACRSSDVAVGISVSGRPNSLAGIETTAGFLANVVPLRAQMDVEGTVGAWLQAMQSKQFESREHDHISLPEILALAETGCQGGCFDNLLVIENLPSLDKHRGPLQLMHYESGVVSGFPLTVTVLPGVQFSLTIDYNREHIDTARVENLAKAFSLTLNGLLQETDQLLGSYVTSLQTLLPIEPSANSSSKSFVSDAEIRLSLRTKVAPRNSTELAMLGLFEEVLQNHSLSMDDDFFEMGGRSIQALKLITLIDKQFQRRLPIIDLIENRTPLALSVKVQGAEPPPKGIPSLITLQQAGLEPGLFCIHAGGGHALFYTEFARQLGQLRPVYALQPLGIDGYDSPLTSIEDMARHYVNEIIRQQPEGPYHLLGHCFGGALVPEMATQLTKQGKSVGHLIITDAEPPMLASHIMAKFGWPAYKGYEIIRNTPLSQLVARVKKLIHEHPFRVAATVKSKSAADDQAPSHLLAVQRACTLAFKSYRAQRCSFKLTLLNSIDEQGNAVREMDMKNWRRFATDPHMVSLPVDHQHIFFDPDVRIITDLVQEHLQEKSENESTDVR
jgi:thioesterase domain-containing protein